MKKFKLFTILLLSCVYSQIDIVNLPEPPWDKLSVGINGQLGYNATFNKNNNLYGLNVLAFGFSVDAEYETEGYWINENCSDDLYYYNYCNDDDWIDSETTDLEIGVDAIFFMPKIGKRFDLKTSDKIDTYYKGELFTVLPIFIFNTNDPELENVLDESMDDLKNISSMFGANIAYGIEYKFNNQLSISTDLGFNFLYNDLNSENLDIDLSARMGYSYALLSLNFSK